jgi:hypothetical protein
MSRKVKEIIRAAGLRDELTFTSFWHDGFTEAGRRIDRSREHGTRPSQVAKGAQAVR